MCNRMPDPRRKHASQGITQSLRNAFTPQTLSLPRCGIQSSEVLRLRAGSFARGKLVLLDALIDDHGQVPANRVHCVDQALRRSVHQE